MKRLVIMIIVVGSVMFIAGKTLDYYYRKYWQLFFEKFDVAIKGKQGNYDGVYLGDSRVHFGINPYYIDSATGKNTYNLGMGGASINEINFLAQQYLQHNKPPQFAVIAIGYSDLLTTDEVFDNPCYYFFYTADSTTNRALEQLHYHTALYKMVPVLKYTVFDEFNKFSVLEGIKGKTFLKKQGIAYHGFMSNASNSFNIQQVDDFVPPDTAFDNNMAVLENMVQAFLAKKTRPVFVYPPVSTHYIKPKAAVENKIDAVVESMAHRYNIPVLHYDTDSSFTTNLFSDQWHLNQQGSVLLSQKLAGTLKKILP